jgi:hypothetical protein
MKNLRCLTNLLLAKNGLDHGEHRGQPLPNVDILCLYGLLLSQHMLKLPVRLLRGQFTNLPFQCLDLILGSLTYSSNTYDQQFLQLQSCL